MKLRITSKENVRDKDTGKLLTPGEEFTKTKERGQQFIDAGVAEEVGGDAPQTLEDLSANVAKVKSTDELQKLADAEKAGQDRKGAYEIFDKRKAELDADAQSKTAKATSKPAAK